MTAKEFLKQYEYADTKARQHRAYYEKLLDQLGSLSVKMDGMPRGSNISRPTEEQALKLAEAADKWRQEEYKALELKEEVYQLIADIPGIEGKVLVERYINLHKWEEICILLHYSWQGVHKVHKRALAIVESRLK